MPLTKEEAIAAFQAWTPTLVSESSNDKKWKVTVGDSAVGKVTKFEYLHEGFWVTFTFKGEHNISTPAARLEKHFWHVVVDKVSLPGLKLDGWAWRVTPRTSSHEKSGVESLSFINENGRFVATVTGVPMIGIHGYADDIPEYAIGGGVPIPEEKNLHTKKNWKLDLTIDAPLA